MTKESWIGLLAVCLCVALTVIGSMHNNQKYIRGSNEMLTEMNAKLRSRQATITSEKASIPQWFVDEFNATFLGSYSIKVENDKLNLVILTSGKSFYDLREIIGWDKTGGISGLGTDMKLDVGEWGYIDHYKEPIELAWGEETQKIMVKEDDAE